MRFFYVPGFAPEGRGARRILFGQVTDESGQTGGDGFQGDGLSLEELELHQFFFAGHLDLL